MMDIKQQATQGQSNPQSDNMMITIKLSELMAIIYKEVREAIDHPGTASSIYFDEIRRKVLDAHMRQTSAGN